MYHLFESIKVENRKFCNLDYHLERMNSSVYQVFNRKGSFGPSDFSIPSNLTTEVYKCRIIYSTDIQSIEYKIYTKKLIKHIKLVEGNDLNYSHKFLDRSAFERLFAGDPAYDEFIILKNGRITDSTFSNLVFGDGVHWYTPDTWLLNGTKRKLLLNSQLIKAVPLTAGQIADFPVVSFINAMLDPGELMADTSHIDTSCFVKKS